MPWTCAPCDLEVPRDDQPCPDCGSAKSMWSMVPEETRTFVIGTKVRCMRWTQSLVDAEFAPAIIKSTGRALVEAGSKPADEDLLLVRAKQQGGAAPEVTLGIDFGSREFEERSFTCTGPVNGGWVDLNLLLVHGEGELPAFEGIEVVDIGEDTETGYAPTVEVSAKGKRSQELPVRSTSEERKKRQVQIVEMEDVGFHTNSAVLLPTPPRERASEEQAAVTGLAAVRAVLRNAEQNPEAVLVVAGHTDSAGSDATNRELSRLRAENVLAYLRGDRSAWAKSAHDRHEVEDWQRILTWLAVHRGWSCDPGGVDNLDGPKSQAGLDGFRAAYTRAKDAPLGDEGPMCKADWGAFYDCYEDDLGRLLGCSTDDLAERRARVQFHEPASIGCGESWPSDAAGIDGHASQTNRRVEFLFFQPADAPTLACHAGGGCDPAQCDLYGANGYKAEYVSIEGDDQVPPEEVVLRLPIWSRDGDPLTGLAVRVEAEGESLEPVTTDGEGVAEIRLRRPIPYAVTLSWEGAGPCSQVYTIDRSGFESERGSEEELRNQFFHNPGLRRALEECLSECSDHIHGADEFRQSLTSTLALLNEEGGR
jgi:hypothetical protein